MCSAGTHQCAAGHKMSLFSTHTTFFSGFVSTRSRSLVNKHSFHTPPRPPTPHWRWLPLMAAEVFAKASIILYRPKKEVCMCVGVHHMAITCLNFCLAPRAEGSMWTEPVPKMRWSRMYPADQSRHEPCACCSCTYGVRACSVAKPSACSRNRRQAV